jgi:hypothetical protein
LESRKIPASHIKKLPHPRHFAKKLARNFLAGFLFLLLSLLIGVAGYHFYFFIGWTDSLYNASMILTGMGPVAVPPDNAAKVFASFYAIYSGVAFLIWVAIILSPIAHRFLHRLRLDIEAE